MRSPFPGMDPWLEAPAIWPDFHHALATEIRNVLNRTLPAPYYARLEMRPEIGVSTDDGVGRQIVPDIVVAHPAKGGPASTATAILDAPRSEISRSFEVAVHHEPVRHHFVEIRDSKQDHKLITLIEILSPSNKRAGADREAYEHKQQEILDSDANLVEIDLLRGGDRIYGNAHLADFVERLEPSPDYLVLVNRAARRIVTGAGYQLFAVALREMLPCIPVPLRREDADVPLDLQYIFERVYDGGPYRRGAVDYGLPPTPVLRSEDAEWAEELLRPDRAQPVPPA